MDSVAAGATFRPRASAVALRISSPNGRRACCSCAAEESAPDAARLRTARRSVLGLTHRGRCAAQLAGPRRCEPRVVARLRLFPALRHGGVDARNALEDAERERDAAEGRADLDALHVRAHAFEHLARDQDALLE